MTTDAQRLDLSPPRITMQWYKGRTVPFTVTLTNSAGTAIDLTGGTAVFTIVDVTGATVKTYQTGGSGISLTAPASGQMTISPEHGTGTADFSIDLTYYGDCLVTLADSTVYPVFHARISLTDRRDK